MKDRSMEKKIINIVGQSIFFTYFSVKIIQLDVDIKYALGTMLFCTIMWTYGYLYKDLEKTKYTFKIWLKIRKLNTQINKLKKVADTNLKGKGRDMNYCNPVYTAREVLEAKQKELKELVR